MSDRCPDCGLKLADYRQTQAFYGWCWMANGPEWGRSFDTWQQQWRWKLHHMLPRCLWRVARVVARPWWERFDLRCLQWYDCEFRMARPEHRYNRRWSRQARKLLARGWGFDGRVDWGVS